MGILGYVIPVQDLVGSVRFSRCSIISGGDVDWAFTAVGPLTLKENSHDVFRSQGKGFSCEAHHRFRCLRESTQACKGFCTYTPMGNLVLSSQGKATLPPPLQLSSVKGATPSPAFLLPHIQFEPPPEVLRRTWEGGIHSRHHGRWDAVIRSLLIRYPG